jgi:hypothetical protein
MEASNAPRRQLAARSARRRPNCQRGGGKAKPRPAEGLKVTIRVIPLPDSDANPLRARQLAVIVNLLRRAAAEAGEQVTSPDDAGSHK